MGIMEENGKRGGKFNFYPLPKIDPDA